MNPIPEIRNSRGERIDHSFHPHSGTANNNLVIIGHGVTGNKDRPFLLALAKALAAVGLPSLRISFAGNGDSEGRFEDATISKEVDDLGCVLDALPHRDLSYVGHSMGGAVGVLRAAADPRIQSLVSLAGMVHTAEFAQRKFGELTPGQGSMWDKPECPLSQEFVDDLRQIDTVLPQAAAITVPWLLVHGTADEVVLPKDSYEAHQSGADQATVIAIPDADHVFSGAATEAMCTAVGDWFAGAGRIR